MPSLFNLRTNMKVVPENNAVIVFLKDMQKVMTDGTGKAAGCDPLV
jgi:hypothetical protein